MTGEYMTTRIEDATPVEALIARHTVRRAIYVAPAVILGFWLLRDVRGLVGSSIGVAVVIGNFLLAGVTLSLAVRISLSVYRAAALFGFLLRMGLIAVTMLVVVQFVDIDRLAFGISAVCTYMVLLTLEAIAMVRGRERDLDWTS